jgi:hypothetical protein
MPHKLLYQEYSGFRGGFIADFWVSEGQFSRIHDDDNCVLASSLKRRKSPGPKPEVSIGGSTFSMQDILVVNLQLPFGMASFVPSIKIGNIGTFSFMASLNAPF